MTVEVDISPAEKMALIIVGLPDSAVKEAKDRVAAALKNSGYPIDRFLCVVNLAPAPLRKEGARYDLPIALAILKARGLLSSAVPFEEFLIAGELSLSGEVRPINGGLPLALLARRQRCRGILLPAANSYEGSAVTPLEVIGVKHLTDAVAFFRGELSLEPMIAPNAHEQIISASDMSDVRGQEQAKRALEIAAAGGHNIALSGPPGTGKSMLARALTTIMPPMTLEESLETTQIHSVAKLLAQDGSLVLQRPFRSPHHTVSYAGLIGGGSTPRPGEVSLAHNGILFLDELPEFSRTALEALRQPLEDRAVTISRAQGNITYPSRFLCITAMNPCPCGYLGHPLRGCHDTENQINRYRSKISGPLWDRLDLHISVPALSFEELHGSSKGESSQQVRTRVIQANQRQQQRYGTGRSNSSLSRRELEHHCQLDSTMMELLQSAMERMHLSARGVDRSLRVALTIADLAQEELQRHHLMEALSYRCIH